MILPIRLEQWSVTYSLETNQRGTLGCVTIPPNQPGQGNAPNKIVLIGPWKNGRRYVRGAGEGEGGGYYQWTWGPIRIGYCTLGSLASANTICTAT